MNSRAGGTDANHSTHRYPYDPDSPPAIHDSAIYNSAPLRDCHASVIHGRDDRAPLSRAPHGSAIRNLGGFIVLACPKFQLRSSVPAGCKRRVYPPVTGLSS